MRKGTVIPALFLILVGGYLLLQQLNVAIPDWEVIWPVFPLGGGIAVLTSYFSGQRRNPDSVFFGTLLSLGGLAFFFITLGPLDYSDLSVWWPVFLLIGSVAFLAQWLAAGLRDWGAFFLAVVSLVIGSAGLAITLELLGAETRELLPKLWPALLVLAGVMVLLRGLFSRRPSADADRD